MENAEERWEDEGERMLPADAVVVVVAVDAADSGNVVVDDVDEAIDGECGTGETAGAASHLS